MNDQEIISFWKAYIENRSDSEQRQGQALVNALRSTSSVLYYMILGDVKADCFYQDSKIPGFFAALGMVNPFE
jgi:hypothetical protein